MNGRFGSESNNFTSTSTRGKTVVDYMVLSHDQLQFVNNLKIITMNEISSILKKYVTDKGKPPDYSILYFNVRMSYNINAMHGGGQQDMHHVQNCENIFIKKYTFDVIPKEFINNQQWNNKLLHCYDTLNAHDDINISYANLLDTLCVEMDTHLKVKGKWKRGRKQYKGAYYYDKPYWTMEF